MPPAGRSRVAKKGILREPGAIFKDGSGSGYNDRASLSAPFHKDGNVSGGAAERDTPSGRA
jgi:hypothetical protein